MNNHEMPMDEKLFELMYELIDIEEIEKEGYRNMVDISVEGNQTYLLGNGILSHNSAKNSVSKILGRQGNGFFAMFGVPPNAYDSDIKKLMDSFNALIDKGHTVLVVEHNMDVAKCADWIIDMGPDGGENGGEVVFAGTPEDIIKVSNNYTAEALSVKMQ